MPFSLASLPEVAGLLNGDSIHLWRIRYQRRQGRAPLLWLLAAYLARPVAAVQLRDAAGGKPELSDTASGLEFNWSHSGEYALIAVTHRLAIGVDVEQTQRACHILELARRFFHPTEAAALAALKGRQRKHAFIALWCAKEALLKARGRGLAFGLDKLVFAYAGRLQWQPARIDRTLGATAHWRMAQFAAAPGYRGALAWWGAQRRVLAFRPPGDVFA